MRKQTHRQGAYRPLFSFSAAYKPRKDEALTAKKMLVDLGRASTSSRRLFIHTKNGAEILRRLISSELLFKIIVIEIGNGCIEIFNAAIVPEDIISHLFALAGVEYLLLVEVVFTELLNALAVSL